VRKMKIRLVVCMVALLVVAGCVATRPDPHWKYKISGDPFASSRPIDTERVREVRVVLEANAKDCPIQNASARIIAPVNIQVPSANPAQQPWLSGEGEGPFELEMTKGGGTFRIKAGYHYPYCPHPYGHGGGSDYYYDGWMRRTDVRRRPSRY
jgi:hypothetical protein